ncbi:DNA-deoxyinosine glycosylase [Sulfurospirillum diekertiae]|mgnify:CR=1 FL=1|jgi:hypoxanthine-DNA glycosylase|uniref:DNA-deoxyinosine glycosylase n=1 Tax=Sulfurospirillum diekertiae TaxID=1854492 RepID=A0A6G9VRR9_9BACT|nr:DNA-deoxyinosine glycosylase [Sulfurospirillum diekertiae]QIR75653.1 DNA-deoxyinosine glycosylase [Sulfurospirillum diekertiae]QIR78302.1 DNA-deoxyinosine glycosylase [Sulfurospirillum diekertiae]
MKHSFDPIYDTNSKVLILGTFPSVKSREQNFYYGHPQNRFWKVIAALTHTPLPISIEEKKAMLLHHGIALWDVIESCDITGSSDSSIKNVVPMDFSNILHHTPITHIYANGATAFKLFQKYCETATGINIIKLPSTSPANAAFSFEKLLHEWSILKI